MKSVSALLLASSLLFASHTDAAVCSVTKLTSFDAQLSSGRIVVDAMIEGQPVKAMLDTGLPFNMISKALAEKLKLSTVSIEGPYVPGNISWLAKNMAIPSLPPESVTMMDAAGGTPTRLATVRQVAFGEIKTENTPFYVMGEASKEAPWPDVIFGATFLETYDLELDLAHGKVNIFFPEHCPGSVVYWTNRFGVVPIKIMTDGHITVPVTVNGTETHAILDTGAPLSLISKLLAADSLGIDPVKDGDALEYVTEPSGARLPVYTHTFDSLIVGDAHFSRTPMGIAPDRLNSATKDMVHFPQRAIYYPTVINTPVTLGMNHIQKLRLYFAFHDNLLYFTSATQE